MDFSLICLLFFSSAASLLVKYFFKSSICSPLSNLAVACIFLNCLMGMNWLSLRMYSLFSVSFVIINFTY